MQSEINAMEQVFGPPVYTYTRAQAISDGILVDVTPTADSVGFSWPVAVTRAVYDRYVAVPEELEGAQDVQGRLCDVLTMLWVAVRTGKIDGTSGLFKFLVRTPSSWEWQENERRDPDTDGLRLVELKTVSGPGDDGSPCITIML